MFQESPSYPHTLAQWLYVALAWFVGTGGTVAWLTAWQKRKHGPAEVRKIYAEARSIEIHNDIDLGDSVLKLVKEVGTAAVEAERLRDERNHWELKAFDLELENKTLKIEKANLLTQAQVDNHYIRKQAAFIEARGLKEAFLQLDEPKS